MKLNKVISLMLGGVMALSMLAGCSSSSTTEEPVVTTTTNTGVVAYVQDNMSASGKYGVGSNQASYTLTGSESTHESKALTYIKSLISSTTDSIASEAVDGVSKFSETSVYMASSTEGDIVITIVKKGQYDTDTEFAQAILTKMKNRASTGQPCIAKMSVFDMTVTGDDTSVVLNGSTVTLNSTEYWVLVTTMATDTTKNNVAFVN